MHYTPAQVQEMLDLPGSTLRYYAKRFEPFLTPRGGRKHRLYTDQDVTVLSHIRDLAAANIPLDVIAGRLPAEQAAPARAQQVENSLALVPTIAAEIANAQETARAAAARADQLAADLDQLREEIKGLRAQLEETSRPWWKKIIRK